jgi:divalent metal cation (Fe/Co/Zn/Cd) transporter
MRQPTRHSRRLVRAVDVATLGLLVGAAVISDSLILAGVVIAGAIMALREAWLVFVPRRLGEQGLRDYQYGFGKILQAGTFVLAGTAAAAGFWLAGVALGQILTGGSEFFPVGLALAASANALVMAWNGVVVYAHHEPSDRARRVLRQARRRLFASLVVIQVLLTVAALAKDPEVVFWIDDLGAILVSLLIVVGGVKLAWECICDLIDHPLDRDQERAMVAALSRMGVEAQELVDLRTRRCADRIFAELTLRTNETVPVEALCQRLVALRRTLEAETEGLDLVIKLQGATT